MALRSPFSCSGYIGMDVFMHQDDLALDGLLVPDDMDLGQMLLVELSQGVQTSIRGPSRAEWIKHRQYITDLYLTQNLTLREVMLRMQTQHGFNATVKMYKTRFRQWDLDKNFRRHEAVAMLVLQLRHQAANMSPSFTVRGRQVNKSNLQRYARRARINLRELLTLAPKDVCQQAPDVVCQIRPLTTKQIEFPDHMINHSKVLHALTTYFSASLEGSMCYVDNDQNLVWNDSVDCDFEHILRYCKVATQKYVKNEMEDAGYLWRLVSLRLEPLVRTPDLGLWLKYLVFRLSVQQLLPPEIQGSLTNHVKSLVETRLDASTPHRWLAWSLCHLDDAEVLPALSFCWTAYLDLLKPYMDATYIQSAEFDLDVFGAVSLQSVPKVSEGFTNIDFDSVGQDLNQLESFLDRQFMRIVTLLNESRWDAVRSFSSALLRYIQLQNDRDPEYWPEADRLEFLGLINFLLAEANYGSSKWEIAKRQFEACLDHEDDIVFLHLCYEHLDQIANCSDIADGDQQWKQKMEEIEQSWREEVIAEVGHLSLKDTSITVSR